MAKKLKGETLGGWTVGQYLGYGKSAVVVQATKAGASGALKIFDQDLVEAHGRHAQAERIERQHGLVGVIHPHLVSILDAGHDINKDTFYVVMELLPPDTIESRLADVPLTIAGSLVAQVSAAAHFLLEKHGVAHRDIKPSNIAVSGSLDRATLLDLGVVRPVGVSGGPTDSSGARDFVGTLRYSPPEFMYRQEEDSLQGWRAVTFYQLGAVLHDLLMGHVLFAENSAPFPRLVAAIDKELPQIPSAGKPWRLVQLARNCLVKDWKTRLELVTWKDLLEADRAAASDGSVQSRLSARLARLRNGGQSLVPPVAEQDFRKSEQLLAGVQQVVDAALGSEIFPSGLTPPIECHSDSGPSVLDVRLTCEPSARHGIRCRLSISLRFIIVSLEEEVVEMSLAAAVGNGVGEAVHAPTRQRIFCGRVDPSILVPVVRDCVFASVDAAAEWSMSDPGCTGSSLLSVDVQGIFEAKA